VQFDPLPVAVATCGHASIVHPRSILYVRNAHAGV
jgi:hypothetical protein